MPRGRVGRIPNARVFGVRRGSPTVNCAFPPPAPCRIAELPLALSHGGLIAGWNQVTSGSRRETDRVAGVAAGLC